MGVVYLTPRCLLPCWWPNVISGSCSAACSVPRRLVLRGNLSAVWDSVEGRRLRRLQPVMAWPAADRGGLFSAAEPTGAVQRRKTARVTFSVFWLAGGVFVRGGKKRDDFEPRRWSGGLVQVPGGGALLLAASTAIPKTSPVRGAVWRVGGPLTRERRAEWRVGSPRTRERRPTAEVARPPRVELLRTWCFSCRRAAELGAAALRRWVLHGSGLLVRWCLPLLLLYQCRNTSVVR